jgi:glucose-6-phosphate 1-epimerase
VTVTDIQMKFGIADVLRFEEGPGGLIRAVISSPQADGEVYLHGAHVTRWTPRGQQAVLFMSSKSRFEAGVPIRGGVPIAFPWFGPRGDGIPGPMHGFARIVEWKLESASLRADGAVELKLGFGPNEVSRAAGFDSFEVHFRAAFGSTLEMELEVRNLSAAPIRFEEALHTYFSVSDIHQVSVKGLEGTTYVDKTDAFARKQSPEPIHISGETDRVYLNTTATCEIEDPGLRRTIVVEKSGSHATVVWNPWIEKNRTIADMAPEDWKSMICVETVNALECPVVLPTGGTHRLQAAIRLRD